MTDHHFISYSRVDGLDFALRRLKHQVTAMQEYVATDQCPLDKCPADVAACDV